MCAATIFSGLPSLYKDQGYLINVVQLPAGSALDRTEKVVRRGIDIILGTKGVEQAGVSARTVLLPPSTS